MADFNLLFGNDKTKKLLGSAIREGRLPHAILISGPRGSGKLTMAKEIIRGVLCERKNGDTIPCDICTTCKRVREEQHTDVHYLRRSHDKASIGVDEVKNLREDMFLSPNECDYKFYVIEEADLMTTGAQNALLKVLEEPPASVHIILLAMSVDNILTTIKSRTQIIRTEILSRARVKEYLKSRAELPPMTKDDDIELAAQFSGGIIGEALLGLDPKRAKINNDTRRMILDFLSSLSVRTPFSRLRASIYAFPTKRDELRGVLEDVLIGLRDLIAVKGTEAAELLFFTSRDEALELMGSIQMKRLCQIAELVLVAVSDTDKNVITTTILSDLTIRIKQL